MPHSGGVKEKIMGPQKLEKAVKAGEDALAGAGKMFVRASGKEPLIRVVMEVKTTKSGQNTADQLASLIKSLKS